MYFLTDISNYSRTSGATDKKKRKSRNLLRNTIVGGGSLAALGIGTLLLKKKLSKPVNIPNPKKVKNTQKVNLRKILIRDALLKEKRPNPAMTPDNKRVLQQYYKNRIVKVVDTLRGNFDYFKASNKNVIDL